MDKLELPYLAYVDVDSRGNILEATDWKKFGYNNVKPGTKIDEIINVFYGLFPLVGDVSLHFPMVLVECGKYLDFDLKPFNGNFRIFALDVTEEARMSRELQQVQNELELIKRQLQ